MKQNTNQADTAPVTGHTPGPWHVANGVYGPSVCGPIQSGLDGGTTAPCICKQGSSHDWEANSRLIAAAPELLNALIHCTGVIHAIRTGNVPPGLIPYIDSERIGRAAIARAEGHD